MEIGGCGVAVSENNWHLKVILNVSLFRENLSVPTVKKFSGFQFVDTALTKDDLQVRNCLLFHYIQKLIFLDYKTII